MTTIDALLATGAAAALAVCWLMGRVVKHDLETAERLNAESAERLEAAVENMRLAKAMREDTARWISQTNPQFWGEL